MYKGVPLTGVEPQPRCVATSPGLATKFSTSQMQQTWDDEGLLKKSTAGTVELTCNSQFTLQGFHVRLRGNTQ